MKKKKKLINNIHKRNTKELSLHNVIIFDKDAAELLAQFYRLKKTKITRLGFC